MIATPTRNVFATDAAVAAAAAVWHGHQLTPMTFSAELNCSDLLALIFFDPLLHDTSCIQILLSINVAHEYHMLSDDFVADRLRPNVCKIVLALDDGLSTCLI